MPHIIPIRDLKNTGEISQLCRESDEPIFVTRNGYGDMVIMSMQVYERLFTQDAFDKPGEAQNDFTTGRTQDTRESL